ncbi:UDP-GlcNAc--UDP-phosphate GlcNAc-1-phosphate transferase [Bacteroidia bacterium]|nr:UDP-GlcNAc--UDP-phosphate GlcNAc-1-phosphate transferase [Bacteroidia bacterium]
MILYFLIADKYNIIDKPNERSSHDYITIRGGGIVFWLAAVLYCLLNLTGFQNLLGLWFLIGITLISGISFWDDIQSLPNKIRIVIHFLSISLVFYGLGMFALPWWLIPTAYIFFVGILNAYNFMDGINGITGLYSLAVLILLQYINCKLIPFTNPDFINYAIIACMVFLFFNFRKKAKCFAGDVGSMAISFWIVTLLLQLMLKTDSFIWILFLAVYGVDSVCTILHRIYLKQNIFKAHRMHFYQILSNERGISHLKVSAGYAFVQLLICWIVIYAGRWNGIKELGIGILIIAFLSIIYSFKFKAIKQKQ